MKVRIINGSYGPLHIGIEVDAALTADRSQCFAYDINNGGWHINNGDFEIIGDDSNNEDTSKDNNSFITMARMSDSFSIEFKKR